jgi:malate synthase
MIPEEIAKVRTLFGEAYNEENMKQATELFIELITQDEFEEFLTIRAYDQLE